MTGLYVPFRYWPEPTKRRLAAALADKGAAAAERIRAQAARPPCSCARPGEATDDGRCGRCWGWPT